MSSEVTIPLAFVFSFWFVLARIATAIAVLPLPGLQGGLGPARVLLAVIVTLALFPLWPQVDPGALNLWRFALWLGGEMLLGLLIGLAVSFFTDAFMLGFQVVGLQAGYFYASMVDPVTQADSGVLLIAARLGAMLLFFAFGLERVVIAAFARSIELIPPGTFLQVGDHLAAGVELSSFMFDVGARLALPAVALLALVDLSIALLGRLNPQLQLMTLVFPAKMLAGLLMLAWTLPVTLGPLRELAEATARYIQAVVVPSW